MALKRPVVLGNWKMNGLRAEGLALAGSIAEKASGLTGTLGLFPPATLLGSVKSRVLDTAILVGGQDCHEKSEGAYTGSVSAPMLADAGADAVLIGHSERRHGLGENDALMAAKMKAAEAAGLLVVLCVGETEAEYMAGSRDDRLAAQLVAVIGDDTSVDRLVVAYEPVWAIGTGRTPSTDEIAGAHRFLRAKLDELTKRGDEIAILYGGSVKPNNAAEIMAMPDVDGVLVGGASLDAESFWSIYTAGGGA